MIGGQTGGPQKAQGAQKPLRLAEELARSGPVGRQWVRGAIRPLAGARGYLK